MREPAAGFYFMRHGQTVANAANISSGGDRDPQLTDFGCDQAISAARVLRRLETGPSLIVASPLRRATETALLIGEHLSLPLKILPSFTERKLGDWNDQCSQLTNNLLISGKTPPGGESRSDFAARINEAYQDLLPLCTQWPLLVSSRGVARVLLERVNCKNAAHYPNGVIARITLTSSDRFEVARVEYLNEPDGGSNTPD